MEEVDQIILASLQNIGCDFANGSEGLAVFTTEQVVEAVVRCIKVIDADFKMSHIFPPGMSARFRVGTTLAQKCGKLGYKSGDLGYQTFLYPSENEIRKIFMFLVEKLPKRDDGVQEESGSAASLLQRRISQVLRQQQQLFHLPAYCHPKPSHHLFQTCPREQQLSAILQQSETRRKLIPTLMERNAHQLAASKTTQQKQDEDEVATKKIRKEDFQWKDANFHVDEVFDMTWSYEQVISKVCKGVKQLANDSRFANSRNLQFTTQESETDKKKPPIPKKRTNLMEKKQEGTAESSATEEGTREEEEEEDQGRSEERREELLQEKLAGLKLKVEQVEGSRSSNADQLHSTHILIEQMREELKEVGKRTEEEKEKLKSKNKVVKLLSNSKENIEKLKELIETSKERRAELEAMWREHERPLTDEMGELERERRATSCDVEGMMREIAIVRRRMKETMGESKKKDQLLHQLKSDWEAMGERAECDRVSRDHYTRRILEIVASIHKQKAEIGKIVDDNRATQKMINNTRARIDRTFAIADEIFFKDAKKDEDIRQAYKLLVALHDVCMSLIQTVEHTGLIVREVRELERQIGKERGKNAEENLKKIRRDYKEMKKENTALMKQLKQQQ